MRYPLIRRQLNSLRIDHHHPHLHRITTKQQTRHYRVDAHTLARTGRTRNQRVRHRSEIRHHGITTATHAKRNRQRRIINELAPLISIHNRTKIHRCRISIRNLYTYYRSTRNHRLKPDIRTLQRKRNVLLTIQDRVYPDALRSCLRLRTTTLPTRLQTIHRHRRTNSNLINRYVYTMLRQRLLDQLTRSLYLCRRDSSRRCLL